jgi:hypothetical protein
MSAGKAGYSGTPLAKKLGIEPGSRVRVVSAPKGYLDLLAPLPEGATVKAGFAASADIVHLFATEQAKLAKALATCRGRLDPAAVVWVSWPKKASKQPTDVTEDRIRALALPLGFVDVKVCAVTEVWSGLKLVVRKALR